ncbi:MAG TPA: hypothetical protein P5081_16180 [Phycisphaerae bacterium]|nr:hypothetical protein [Phycisphaerae bacterium]HRW54409.1 hypothetical protein [Phycisphaerae bacterium]
MTPHDDMEKLLAEAPLAKAPAEDIQRVRRRIAGARGAARPAVWRRSISVGLAAAACVVVGLLSVVGTALVMNGTRQSDREPTSGPGISPSEPRGAQPRFVVVTDFFSHGSNLRDESKVDITQWGAGVAPRGE